MSSSERKHTSKGGGHGGGHVVPVYKKYAGNADKTWLDPSSKLKPSDMSKPAVDVKSDEYPMIIEFSNLKDNSTQVHSMVEIDQPLFQPSPKVVVFEEYAPFAIHEKKLFFRNNDAVARRIKLVQPDTPFFEMSAPRLASGEPLQQSKIAAGMEIYFVVRFKPQEVRDYSWDLICCTEREKFVVPLRAIGMRPRMTFPDEIHFGSCPVKSAQRKCLLVQNIGSSVARFSIRSLHSVFSCTSEEMVVDPGQSQMIEIFFTPPTAHGVQGELEVEFTKGAKCYIMVTGTGKNVDVSLSTPSVALEPSYISLASQKTMRIKNMSEVPINFCWKSFSNEEDEEAERARLLIEIDRMEEIERSGLLKRVQDGYYYNTDGEEDLMDEGFDGIVDVEEGDMPFGARAEEAALVRKYRNLRRALEVDPMQFVDDIFEVSPVEGQVWANSELEITVSFRPDTAAQYTCFAYLDISGRQDRLSLNLSGQGIGPHATLSFDVLDVGDIFINDEQRYEISINNKGDIPAQWTFMSSLTRFGSKFQFSPKEGCLLPGQSQPVSIVFESDVLGEFSEHFRFALQGNEDMLVCQIKGHIVGPTFHFDCTSIDFGIVSFDYLHSSTLRLVNTSKIAMVFNLHVPQDGTYLKKEFNIEPSEGTLTPGQYMDVLLEFIPGSVKVYDYSLAVDVFGVGDVLLSVPISAECIVSTVRMSTREIDFGECFIRYPYEKELTLTNLSDKVHTKFEVLPQAQFTKATALYEAEPAVAVIEPSDSMSIKLKLVAEKLGQFKIPILVAIAGSQEPPIQAVLVFSVIGPRVVVDSTELRWGNIECLKDSVRSVKITNDSLIMASMKLFLKQARSKFELAIRELVLQPNESYDLAVTANLDDSVVIKDEIHLVVEESNNVMLPLSAKGIGTTMHCGQELSTLDLGVQLTNTSFERRVVLENKGRRPQYLKWTNITVRDDNIERAAKAKKLGKDPAARLPKNLAPREPYFTVTPEEITLRSRTATTFTFKGKVDTVGLVSETFVLESRVGKERVMKPIMETKVICDVVNPLLQFSEPQMSFIYQWERGVEPLVQKRDLQLKNNTAVPLTFVLKTEIPFNLNSWEHTLAPGQSCDLVVEFDPLYKDDMKSHVVEKALSVTYRGHPQKDSIALVGEIIFPNLDIETRVVNFGCILNDISKTLRVKLTNTSKVVASYQWTFVDSTALAAKPAMGKKAAPPGVPSNLCFDILPIRSVLGPGESEDVEFTMFGTANTKFSGNALCLVEGGPEYKVSIAGEASTVAFAIDRSFIDFGKVVYTERCDQEFVVSNTGRVIFNYKVTPGTTAAGEMIEVIPNEGKVAPGEKLKLQVRMRPGMPATIAEDIMVQIALFDPVKITCYCEGIFSSAVLTLPRQRKIGPYGETEGQLSVLWADFIALATTNLMTPDESKLPPSLDNAPPPAFGNTALPPVFEMPPLPGEDENADALDTVSFAGNLSLGSGRGPTQTNLEVEMHRLAMCRLLALKIDEVKATLAMEAAALASETDAALLGTGPQPAAISKGKRLASSATAGTKRSSKDDDAFPGLQSFISKNIDVKEIVAANYLCDFGNVILGQTRKKVFKVMNASLVGQLNFVLDSAKISGNGFMLEPMKVQKLAESDGIDFVVKFTARMNSKVGKRVSVLPLENKDSPTLNVVLAANVCIPDIEMSVESIDMEKVLVGRSKKVFVRLHNTAPVTATWSFKKVAGKDDPRITITPSEGSLRADRKTIICVEFIPTDARKFVFESLLKVESNVKTKTLRVVGEGVGALVKFNPPMMELGPVVPFTDGDEKIITLSNDSDFAIEVYSLDFDKSYKEEDTTLAAIDLFDREGIYRSDVRNAGDALPESIYNAYKLATAEPPAPAEGNGDAAVDAEGANVEGEGNVPAEPVVVLEVPPLRTGTAPRDEAQHQDILVVGPPISGVSTMANNLSKKLQLVVRKVDTIIEDIARCEGPFGVTARRCSNSMTESEKQTISAQEEELLAKANASKQAADDAFKADKKNKGKETPPELLLTPEVAAYQEFVDAGSLTPQTLAQLITHRLAWKDVGYGLVIDGINSDYASQETVAQGIELSIPKVIVANITVNGGEEDFALRIAQLYATKNAEVEKLKKAVAHGRKALAKKLSAKGSTKGKKGATAASHSATAGGNTITMTMTMAKQSNEIPIALPSGDEPWVNAESGLIMELDSQDIKSLEEHHKTLYTKQLLYYQHCTLLASQEVLRKIVRIWSPETGLKTEHDVPVQEETSAAADAAPILEGDAAAAAATEASAAAATEAAPEASLEEGGEHAAAAEGGDAHLDAHSEDTTTLSKLERAVLYCEYINNVLPLLSTMFKPLVVEEAAPGETPAAEAPLDAAAAEGSEGGTGGAGGEEIAVSASSPAAPDCGVFEINLEGDESEEVAFSNVMALLPPPKVAPEDKDAVPPSCVYQVIRRPLPRSDRKAIRVFEILRYDPEADAAAAAASEAAAEAAAAAAAAPAGKKGAPAAAPVEVPVVEAAPTSYRWIIEPFSSVQIKIRFRSQVEGNFDANLGFEVMGSQQPFSMFVSGYCEVPKINGDSRNVFMRRVKSIAGAAPPNKRFVISDNFFSFGPLLVFKKPEWRSVGEEPSEEQKQNLQLVQTNTDIVRVSNNGRYKCTVEMGLEDTDPEANGIFLVEPLNLELEEGETKDVRIWAFPNAVREYKNTLLACVTNNAVPLRFDLKCWGVEPTIDVDGPWGEGLKEAEAAVAACTDKKLIGDLQAKLDALKAAFTLDFDRLLIGKTDTRTFEIKNTSLLPIAWEIDAGEFTDSQNISISPLGGTMPVNGSVTISLTFTSPEPLMLTGKFSLRFSDAEGGLKTATRVGTRNFRAVAEAYKIQAVSLTADGQEEGGSDVDFGTLRVGDYASQIVKISNKGKYKIGYKFMIVKPGTASLVTIEPSEGVVEAGTAQAEVKLTFCAAAGSEVQLKGNKDIRVQISEPTTGEVVETFPLYLSANAKFNRFRMQPSKGNSFGAVRFDSEAKTKRVELRNEGNFDFTYVVCAKSSEVDELDALDAAALSCYAYSTPAAMRKGELGENYLERMAGGGGAKGGKDAKAAPAKGGKGAAPAAGGGNSKLNPLVVDPDALPEGTLPTDPLVIGAFTVNPRIGVVAPGEVVGIDMKFDPAGCDVARERLRICISGTDEKDANTITVRSFEMTGESCFPAIVNDDPSNIFEEQEVVGSLADVSGASSSGEGAQGGKFEKLPVGKVVYAESEKMLAFGPVMCGQAGAKGVVERIRITNPTKIDTKVRFKIISPEVAAELAAAAKGAGAAAGGKGGKDAKKDAKAAPAKGGAAEAVLSDVFSVQPEVWDIPPHEHRFVSIYFNPLEIKSYRSVFYGEVDMEGAETSAAPKSSSSSGKTLIFDLAGSGTLPCIAIDQPTERAADGSLGMDFGRVHIQRSNKKKFVIRNDGAMPATCLFEMTGDNDFLFAHAAASLTIAPGSKQELIITFAPKKVFDTPGGARSAQIKVTVLNNLFDQYILKMKASAYACDAMIDTASAAQDEDEENMDAATDGAAATKNEDMVTFPELNLAEGPSSSTNTITLRSRSAYPLKFELAAAEGVPKVFSFSPSTGHLGPNSTREVTITFATAEPVKLDASLVNCSLKRIEYKPNPSIAEDNQAALDAEQELWGLWDDSMKSNRNATEADLAQIAQAEEAMKTYLENKAAEEAKGKKGKPVGPPPEKCRLEKGPTSEDGVETIFEIIGEPFSELVPDAEVQQLTVTCKAVADIAKYKCEFDGENITFKPTHLFQSTIHKFTFSNLSNIAMPMRWTLDDIKRRATTRAGTAATGGLQSRVGTARIAAPLSIPCPFFIDPEDCEVAPNSEKQFTLRFQPLDTDDFMYLLKGETIASPAAPPAAGGGAADADVPVSPYAGPIRMVIRGTSKRPICHFDIKESPEYLSRRALNMKNENGLNSPIEAGDLRVVEIESTGLRTRNTFRFHIINPTSDNYEFIWESIGDPSPSWRCVQSSGMLFGGKRIEIVFEYLPEETSVAESFYKFRLPHMGLEQIFLFAGKVVEPKVLFSTSRVDFHSVMLGGEGSNEVVYLENQEHLPFNFAFDRASLLQLDGPNGPVLDINPKAGTVAPYGKVPISFLFKPQEEVVYNFNLTCDVKRKPNKLSLNIKGEGYSIHPVVQLEQTEMTISGSRFLVLKHGQPNYADFGAVQVLDTLSKTITVTNNGKYNYDYIWDTDSMGNMCSLGGGRMSGTQHKGEEMTYTITFAPQREASLDGALISFTVAGKYTYDIYLRGSAVQPALRFSFMHYDFGACFVTSPGGSTVVEEATLRIVNHDPVSNISVECTYQKTRALWADCPPTVLEPGAVLDVPIRFAPRDVKDYTFSIPFVVNATSKVPVTVIGRGINARLEMVSASQRNTRFGLVNVGAEVRKLIALVNRSKKALPVQLVEEGGGAGGGLEDKCISYFPRNEFVIAPRETVNLQITFNPSRRIPTFSEDLCIRYAGVTRKLLTLSGKAQGIEIALDTDSLPFGNVVIDSQKVKKLSLENSGDIGITFSWIEATFGKHFSITPVSGKLPPNSEMSFDVEFKPAFLDEDIRQDGITLSIPGISPLQLTCTGGCIPQPSESTQTLLFNSLARKIDTKSVKISNPTDKDWYLSPSLQGNNWKTPGEFKVPAKGAADLVVTYFPLTMTGPAPAGGGAAAPEGDEEDKAHKGQLFVAMPDGSAQLYKLRGYAGPPECSGQLTIETAAKKPQSLSVKLNNWLGELQKLKVDVDLTEKPSPATFVIAANAVEIGPNGTKEFPLRFVSFTEGNSKGRITFTNPISGEYAFYELTAKTTMPEVLETIQIESPVRQSARVVVSLENPLPAGEVVTMGSSAKPDDWWSCDSPAVRVKELVPLTGSAEGSFEIEYRPLAPTAQPTEHLLTITSRELGTYKYKLVVVASPPSLAASLRFQVPLGSVQSETFLFKAFNNAKVDYTCVVKRPDFFSVAKTLTCEAVSAWEGDDMRVSVAFEPTEIGELRDMLTVTAPGGVEYVCELIAECISPLPQGPYSFVQGGGAQDVSFRNFLPAACAWTFSLDTNAFKLGAATAQVPAKSDGKVSVTFDPQSEHLATPGGVVAAKLFVTCSAKPELAPFVFYLKGALGGAGAAAASPPAKKK